MKNLVIRKAEIADYGQWHELWTRYLEFYKSSVEEAVYETTWSRFFSGNEYDPRCLVCEQDGKLLGLVHYIPHRHCWREENVIYLQDLFVSSDARNMGVGRKLIEAVYDIADQNGTPNVYWMTQDFNETARHLYDEVADLTPFIKYQRPARK